MIRRLTQTLCLLAIAMMALVACGDDEETVEDMNKQTILIYMPWAGNLYEFFTENIDSIESAIVANKGTGKSRVMLYLSESPQESKLSEIVYNATTRKCERQLVKSYSGAEYTTAEGIASILNEVKAHAEALNYAMIIGCHGTGWTFKDAWNNYPYRAPGQRGALKASATTAATEAGANKWDATRFYGALENPTFQTDVNVLAEGIAQAGIKMQYILFDDCYMGNIETAYELRNATNFIIASTSEVLVFGMPYHTMWDYLCTPTPNYAAAVKEFLTFYQNYAPYGEPLHFGTLSAIDCREMDKVAEIMKHVNESFQLDENLRDSIQRLDGFAPVLFYDFMDYVEHVCTDPLLLNKMKNEMNILIKSTVSTDSIRTAVGVIPGMRFIVPKTNCGISVSDPSTHPVTTRSHHRTAWYQATH